MTGIEAGPDFTLEECGLASIGLAQVVGQINKRLGNSTQGTIHVHVSIIDMVDAETIAEVAAVIAAARAAAAGAAAEAM